jgi:hypothetical protein
VLGEIYDTFLQDFQAASKGALGPLCSNVGHLGKFGLTSDQRHLGELGLSWATQEKAQNETR